MKWSVKIRDATKGETDGFTVVKAVETVIELSDREVGDLVAKAIVEQHEPIADTLFIRAVKRNTKGGM